MANTKISALTAATTPDGTELVPVVQGGVTKKATVAQLTGATVSLAERDWTLPTGQLAQTCDRLQAQNDVAGQMSSGRMNLVAIYLRAGMTVAHISFLSAATPASGATHCWFALYSSARSLLGVTNDDTAASPWAANTLKPLDLAVAYPVTASGLYYVGVVVVGTVPTLRCGPIQATPSGLAPIICGISTTGLTTPGTAPDPAAAITAQTGQPYACVS